MTSETPGKVSFEAGNHNSGSLPDPTATADTGAPVVEAGDVEATLENTRGSSEEDPECGDKGKNAMKSSKIRFENVNFTGGDGKKILKNVSGVVKSGQTLAIMGPSGAGKSTLIKALSLEANFGTPSGNVTLNGVELTDRILKKHCYVVEQYDKHWPYLTCRETLRYGAQLYVVAGCPYSMSIDEKVEFIINMMGLTSCADTKNARLSGGQKRRLSIGVALLKQPTVLFLDEPTSGLDAASAENIMREIVRVGNASRLIILCTIHQPSTRVYNSFDQVMIMSRGRTAFIGDTAAAVPYFDGIGHACPPSTNPAEFFLDLVNGDFSDDKVVEGILESWGSTTAPNGASLHGQYSNLDDNDETTQGIVDGSSLSKQAEIMILFQRHFALTVRDPILYVGRCVVLLAMNAIFALVYWNARDDEQEQVLNKVWVNIWMVGVPANMGVVAVYALNDEWKTIFRENKNGMVSVASYVVVKTVLVLPVFFLFALFALGIPEFVIVSTPADNFFLIIALFAAVMFVFESVAEALSVWFSDPILGMLLFMAYWFGSFLFGGFLIPERDLYPPFSIIYHVMPLGYYMRSCMYLVISPSTFDSCTDPDASAVCTPYTSGEAVLDALGSNMPLFSSDDDVAFDFTIIIAIGLFYKMLYMMGLVYNTKKVATFQANEASASTT